jgi:hypothetical protein
MTDAENNIERTEYNVMGQMTKRTNASTNISTMMPGWLERTESPSGIEHCMTYDKNGTA